MDAMHAYMGDEDYRELSPAEKAAEALAVTFKARNLLRDTAWWREELDAQGTAIEAELPLLLSLIGERCLAIPEADARGKEILSTAIADHVERFMWNVAYRRAKEQTQELAEAGDLA